ncbi:uncharacterized protein LOC133300041 [Gastrolobium bilobum]|uniref:uncharacterized protein LOC133300041 n=1 Tax=Gastrolobium bilobum TaxID=150636 RepID=UPI002AB2F680|nr:uncharacterized protein LOC133300041 [Gastrolobium bilobum]
MAVAQPSPSSASPIADSRNARTRRKNIIDQKKKSKQLIDALNISKMPDLTDNRNARTRRKNLIDQKKKSKQFIDALNIRKMPDLTEIDDAPDMTMHSTLTALSNEHSISRWKYRSIRNTPIDVGELRNVSSNDDTDFNDHHLPNIASVSEDYWDVGDPTFVCAHCGAHMWYEERLRKERKASTPAFSLCCANGKVKLPLLKVAPDTLIQLHDNSNNRSRHFLRNIRAYNMIFSFTSFKAKVVGSVNQGSSPYCFRVGRRVHHLMGSLLPPDSQTPKFAQLYIYDIDHEVDNRLGSLSSTRSEDMLDLDIVQSLKEMLDKYNTVAQSFRYARDRYKEDDFNGVKLRLIRRRGSDGRVYNLPSASEVAALIVGDIDSALGDRDIIIETQNRLLQRIDVKHPLYLALQYPLLFPYGEDGYRDDVQRTSISSGRTNPRSTISRREFFSFRLQMRSEESEVLTQSRQLFQQFLVDAYTMIEHERLNFIRYNQNQLRVEINKNIIHAFDRGEDRADRTDVCTIKFQKRGLPYAYILVFLHPSNKPDTGLDIDKLISAEIPNKEINPSLFAVVTSYMMHEPCGPENYKSPCMKEGKCSKKFSKKFCSRTIIDDDRFPHYRRRNDGRVVNKNGVELDNRYVVPYSAKLLLKYQAHINVEYTCQSSAIKYLFKYIHKGNDRVTAAIHHSNDEIKKF